MWNRNDAAYYNGAFCGKTGYTSLAGNTLVTCAKRGDMTLIAVVLNGHLTHYTDTKAMLDFGFGNFQSLKISEFETTYTSLDNDMTIAGMTAKDTISLDLDEDSRIVIPKSAGFSDAVPHLSYTLDRNAPSNAIAQVNYTYGDQPVGRSYLLLGGAGARTAAGRRRTVPAPMAADRRRADRMETAAARRRIPLMATVAGRRRTVPTATAASQRTVPTPTEASRRTALTATTPAPPQTALTAATPAPYQTVQTLGAPPRLRRFRSDPARRRRRQTGRRLTQHRDQLQDSLQPRGRAGNRRLPCRDHGHHRGGQALCAQATGGHGAAETAAQNPTPGGYRLLNRGI